MIDRETIQSIMDTARIEEVVGDFVSLNKRGANYIGLCPFHDEKTPSFTVSPAKGIYKCFGCGKAGNSVGFIMEHEHYTYPEALRFVGKKYHIEIKEKEQTPQMIEAENEREGLFNITAFANKFFIDYLHNSPNGKAIGLSYLKEREFKTASIETFEVGYSPEDWDAFYNHAVNNGYKTDLMVKAGLIIEKDSKRYDRFRSRIIFPIHNLSGRIIGFGGRIMNPQESKAKYINSPETLIYNKSKVLYGIYFAKNEIIKKDNCFLVEGYTDVISLHQSGIKNTISSSGTSLTQDQIRLIKRYTLNITILYDGDEAGLKASFRGIDMILQEGMNVKIVLFPDGEDPDSYCKSHRTSEIEQFISEEAKDFIKFKTGLLLKEVKNDPAKRAGLIKDIVQSISLIPDGITRSVYIKECSSMMNTGERILMAELNKLRINKRFKNREASARIVRDLPDSIPHPEDKQIEVDPFDTTEQEKDVIRILLSYGDQKIIFKEIDEHERVHEETVGVAHFIINDLKDDGIEFSHPVYNSIFKEFEAKSEQEIQLNEKALTNHPDQKISSTAIDLMTSKYILSENWEKKAGILVTMEKEKLKVAVLNAILSLKSKTIEKMIFEKQNELQTATEDDINILLHEIQNLKNLSKDINAQLGRVIIK